MQGIFQWQSALHAVYYYLPDLPVIKHLPATWRRFVKECKQPAKGGDPKSLRYVGSMVADVHRTLLYGGVFMYPADSKTNTGKLRLLYEAS